MTKRSRAPDLPPKPPKHRAIFTRARGRVYRRQPDRGADATLALQIMYSGGVGGLVKVEETLANKLQFTSEDLKTKFDLSYPVTEQERATYMRKAMKRKSMKFSLLDVHNLQEARKKRILRGHIVRYNFVRQDI